MRKYTLLSLIVFLFTFEVYAQQTIVTDDFIAIGEQAVKGQVSSTTTVNESIQENTALTSVISSGYDISKYLEAKEASCSSQLVVGPVSCNSPAGVFVGINLSPTPAGATGYNWSVSPSNLYGYYQGRGGPQLITTHAKPGTTFQVSVQVTGGVCNGQVFTTSFTTPSCF